MLFRRLSCPAKENPGLYCGVSRAKSSMRRLTVGSTSMASRGSEVAAPVRSGLKTASAWVAVTVMPSTAMALSRSVNCRSVATPRFSVTFSRVCGSCPM
jgi:hypothetical protein